LTGTAYGAQAYDLVIKGGTVIDPGRKLHALLDVAIAKGKIAAVHADIAPGGAQVVNAAGQLVIPGMIDIHTHGTMEPTAPGLMLADGVTGWIDAGSQGAKGIEQAVAAAKAAPERAGVLVNIGRDGVPAGGGDTLDLNLADVAAAKEAIAKHRDFVVGVKARLSQTIAGDHDLEVLRRAIEAAGKLPVMIHVGQTYSPLGKLLDLLRPGDIVTHPYSPPPHAIIEDGKLIPEAIAARKRGVIFDLGNGTRQHVRWDIAEAAIAQGFLPDTISTDWTPYGFKAGVVAMPTVMSNMLSLGVPLDQVIAMVTCNAAPTFPIFKGRGTLKPGAVADVAMIELKRGEFELVDNLGAKRVAKERFFTSATVLAGKLVPKVG
jgi:dihydroorotase